MSDSKQTKYLVRWAPMPTAAFHSEQTASTPEQAIEQAISSWSTRWSGVGPHINADDVRIVEDMWARWDVLPAMSDPIDVAARWAIERAVEDWIEDGWETCPPDVGGDDFDRIVLRMRTLLPLDAVTVEEIREAYRLLEQQAKETEHE